METDLLSLFLLGLGGFLHCAGMCGPLVAALAGTARRGGVAAWHAGRLATYAAAGAVAGAAGGVAGTDGAAPPGGLARAQVALSLVSATLLLVLGLVRLGLLREPRFLSAPAGAFGRVAARLRGGGTARYALLGALFGLLPCGLSWGAFARALAAPDAAEGAAMTLAFGLGTLPGLVLAGTAAAVALRRHVRLADLAAGVLMVAMAATLVARAVPALAG